MSGKYDSIYNDDVVSKTGVIDLIRICPDKKKSWPEEGEGQT